MSPDQTGANNNVALHLHTSNKIPRYLAGKSSPPSCLRSSVRVFSQPPPPPPRHTTLSFSRFATGLISSFVILSPPPVIAMSRDLSVCTISHFTLSCRSIATAFLSILSLSLSPAFRIRAPPSVHLFFLFSKYRTHVSKRVAAYFDFVSSNHDRESEFSFLFLFFFPSQLFESSRVLSSPNPNPSSIPRWELYLHSLTTWRGSRVDLFLIPFPFLKWSITIASSHFPFSFRNPFHDLLSDLSLRRECYRERKKKKNLRFFSLRTFLFFFFYFSVNPPSPPLSNQVVAVVVVRQPS